MSGCWVLANDHLLTGYTYFFTDLKSQVRAFAQAWSEEQLMQEVLAPFTCECSRLLH